MIISEKQIIQLMQFAQVYINALDSLYAFEPSLLSDCGLHNKVHVANLLMTIGSQQSDELKEIKDVNNK